MHKEKLDLARTSVLGNVDLGLRSWGSRGNLEALEVTEERSVLERRKSTGVGEIVDLAGAAKGGAALLVGIGIGGEESLALEVGNNGLNIGEDVTLEDTSSSGLTSLKSMASIAVPDVVDGVQEGASTQGRAAARGVIDVVVLQSDLVSLAHHLEGPVVVSIASGREGTFAVDEVVGKSHTLAGVEAEDVVLTSNTSSLHVISIRSGRR